MSRLEAEELIGKPDYKRAGLAGIPDRVPTVGCFFLDYDVFEVRYEHEQLVSMRVRST